MRLSIKHDIVRWCIGCSTAALPIAVTMSGRVWVDDAVRLAVSKRFQPGRPIVPTLRPSAKDGIAPHRTCPLHAQRSAQRAIGENPKSSCT